MSRGANITDEIRSRFPDIHFHHQDTRDEFPTLWVPAQNLTGILGYLKEGIPSPYKMLYDLTAIDERVRENKTGFPDTDLTVVYLLFSFDRNDFLRLKVGLKDDDPVVPTITSCWPAANWYEREVFDMFNIRFEGHPMLRRILMPPTWKGHPLRKDHHARATETDPFEFCDDPWMTDEASMQFRPADWGLEEYGEESDFMFLNFGPHHPGTHGVLRLVLQLDGEEIMDIVPDIGYHHRGAEKMGERQSWHTYIPYTDRVDYLGGVMNNLAYLLTVEKLAGITVPPRAQVIRVMLCELFRLSSHLVWYGTFAQDVGQLSPVFYMFSDRERIFDIIEAICGDRMHPNWFRIGGIAQDLPEGWHKIIREFIDYFPKRLREYDRMIVKNRIFKARTVGIGIYNTEEAMEWGVTGPGLRATGYEWDFRKKRPYSGYEQYDFDIPVGKNGDCYDRTLVRIEEMHQSLRIIEQCLENMPAGHYMSENRLATPPRKERTMHDIETLINHFLNVSWGPVIPPGEAFSSIEATKGNNGYYLVSDGKTTSYRTRIRTPSFPHIQMTPFISRGYTIADLISILGSIDFVLADVDR
jgi:NADH-quinone oxidoreductase subunit C/D